MKMPPMFVTLRINPRDGDEEEGFTLWIPLFIIVPLVLIILLALFLVALPFLILSVILTWRFDWLRWLAFALPAFFGTMHELSGIKVDVVDGRQKIFIDVR
jgi:hypothetical protein